MARRGGTQKPPDEPSTIAVGQYCFKKCQKIGEGTYGKVYKAYNVDMKIEVAIKTVAVDSKEGVPGTCLREVSLLKELNHPNIVRLHDVVCHDESRKLYMIFEYVDYDLKMFIDKIRPRPLPVHYIKSVLWQLLRALSHCHTHRVLHRDLKPQNVLIKADGTVKLADFGLARTFTMPSRRFTQRIVTLWYRAPEILLRAKFYSTAIDIWSLACIFAELVTLEPLFAADTEIELLYTIFRTLGTPTPYTWPEILDCLDYHENFPMWKECALSERVPGLDSDGLDLLAQMLLYPPEKRITSKAALSHRFLRDVPVNLEPVTTLLERRNPPLRISLD